MISTCHGGTKRRQKGVGSWPCVRCPENYGEQAKLLQMG